MNNILKFPKIKEERNKHLAFNNLMNDCESLCKEMNIIHNYVPNEILNIITRVNKLFVKINSVDQSQLNDDDNDLYCSVVDLLIKETDRLTILIKKSKFKIIKSA